MMAEAGYSGTPLIRKPGFSGIRPAVVMNPPRPYAELLGEAVDIVVKAVLPQFLTGACTCTFSPPSAPRWRPC